MLRDVLFDFASRDISLRTLLKRELLTMEIVFGSVFLCVLL